MSPLALELVRRLSWLALIVAAVLLAAPPALTYLGLLGPSVPDQIEAAERALTAARSYGGGLRNAPRAPRRSSLLAT